MLKIIQQEKLVILLFLFFKQNLSIQSFLSRNNLLKQLVYNAILDRAKKFQTNSLVVSRCITHWKNLLPYHVPSTKILSEIDEFCTHLASTQQSENILKVSGCLMIFLFFFFFFYIMPLSFLFLFLLLFLFLSPLPVFLSSSFPLSSS